MLTPVPDPVPAPIGEWAEACVRFVKDALGLPLDYTPETLPILDHYVRTKASDPSEPIRDLLATALGAYFGEVVRRSLEGVRWHVAGDAHSAYRVEFDAIFLHFNPLGIALEVLSQSDAELPASFQVLDEARTIVEEALAQAGEISPDDYYTFTIRYETLELVISLLTGLEAKHQGTPRRFGPEVYRAAAGESVGNGASS
jgi:hypothetical protein